MPCRKSSHSVFLPQADPPVLRRTLHAFSLLFYFTMFSFSRLYHAEKTSNFLFAAVRSTRSAFCLIGNTEQFPTKQKDQKLISQLLIFLCLLLISQQRWFPFCYRNRKPCILCEASSVRHTCCTLQGWERSSSSSLCGCLFYLWNACS